jgi:hypothetical protein
VAAHVGGVRAGGRDDAVALGSVKYLLRH